MAELKFQEFLNSAALNGMHEDVKNWIDQQVNMKDDANQLTALHKASIAGHLTSVKYFIQIGAQINIEDKYEFTPLHNAADQGHLEIVQVLLANGANIEAKANRNKQTPLFLAANGDHLEVVKFLIDNGAQTNAKDKSGITALEFASDKGFLEIVQHLTLHGANIDTRNEHG